MPIIKGVDSFTAGGITQIAEYDPAWPELFRRLRARIWPAVDDLAVAIEHIGSTSVPGLAAKPVIDTDLVIQSRKEAPAVIFRLQELGYEHRGNLGIEDREAFRTPEGEIPHHLYVCPKASVALRNHLVLRDHLRGHPLDVEAYSALKRELAERFPRDIDRYVEGKSEFILSVLAQYGFCTDQLESIRSENLARDTRSTRLG